MIARLVAKECLHLMRHVSAKLGIIEIDGKCGMCAGLLTFIAEVRSEGRIREPSANFIPPGTVKCILQPYWKKFDVFELPNYIPNLLCSVWGLLVAAEQNRRNKIKISTHPR